MFRFQATEPTALDPGLVGDFTTLQYWQLLWEGLVGRDKDNHLQPRGAESYTISDDGTVFTFKLRKEAKFSDGSAVTARDYEWTLKRNLDPASGSKYAHSLYPLKNASAFNRGEIKDRDAVGAKALDDYTLQLTTERPAPYLIALIAATWTLFPLKRDVVEKYGDKWTEADHIVTNGPLMVQSWKHDQEMVLVPNPHYWGERPVLQRVTLQLVRRPAESGARKLREQRARLRRRSQPRSGPRAKGRGQGQRGKTGQQRRHPLGRFRLGPPAFRRRAGAQGVLSSH